MKFIITILIGSLSLNSFSQSQTKNVLFLGNSYTYVNNLPQLVADVAASTGDSLIFDSNTIGGYTLQMHSVDTTSINKIVQGNWNYVVLQEQSQLPSFPISQVQTDCFPYAHFLDSVINKYNHCVETVFYMTWGRQYGDASNCPAWPPVCTYEGMDSLLHLRYQMMADSNAAILSPVGAVWNYVRQNYPLINLYQADASHPTAEGSYVAACCFYTTLFRKDPTLISFNSTLATNDADNIKYAAKVIVFDSLLNWHIGAYDPVADFSTAFFGGSQFAFSNTSTNALTYLWNFGDGDTSTSASPSHSYLTPGSYNVTLIAGNCYHQDTIVQTVVLNSAGIPTTSFLNDTKVIYPNPAISVMNIKYINVGIDSYKINSINGMEVKCGSFNNFNSAIPVSAIADGGYFLQLFSKGNLIIQQKFIKATH